MNPIKDDFLILGFTGAFSSGCSTSALFFINELKKVKNALIGEKSETDSDIANFYNQFEHKDETFKINELKILDVARKRQFINVLENIGETEFYYISMTDVMHSLLIEYFLTTPKNNINRKYGDLIKLINNWSKKTNWNSKNCKEIKSILERRIIKKEKSLTRYLDDLKSFREILNQNYRHKPIKLFKLMQEIGNNLRKLGNPFGSSMIFQNSKFLTILAERACDILKFYREFKKKNKPGDHRTYFLIECFRNPHEIEYFRRRFHEFFLFSIYSDEKIRFKRAKEKYGLSEKDCLIIDRVDQGGDFFSEQFSQNIKRCVYLSDITLTNQYQEYDLYLKLLNYYALIKSPGCVKPTHQERNMNLAYSFSLNSTCICRQVGSVIINKSYVVGGGWNDTGGERIGCIYRLRGDVKRTDNISFPICAEKDYEKFKKLITDGRNLNHSFCFKDEMGELAKEKVRGKEIKTDDFDLLDEIETRSLQFCRALHAEENAILQTARIGGSELTGAVLYTTTFPCELCAKKILQVGIKEVVYCEPYPKSISLEVFFKETFSKINITPFEGVKSPSFYRLFKSPIDIKDRQELEIMETNRK